MPGKQHYITLGRVARGQGLEGEVRFRAYIRQPGIVEQLHRILLQFPDGREKEFNVRRTRQQGKQVLLLFEGITDRTAADALSGARLLAARSDLPQLPAGEYYPGELEGYTVVALDGEVIGPVEEVWQLPASDVLRVDHHGREALIPVVESIIVRVEHDSRRIVINVLEGLLD